MVCCLGAQLELEPEHLDMAFSMQILEFVVSLTKSCLVSREGKITSVLDEGGEMVGEHMRPTI